MYKLRKYLEIFLSTFSSTNFLIISFPVYFDLGVTGDSLEIDIALVRSFHHHLSISLDLFILLEIFIFKHDEVVSVGKVFKALIIEQILCTPST